MTSKEREWLKSYVEMMKACLAIAPGVTLDGFETNAAVIDRIVEVQMALNEDAAKPYPHVTNKETKSSLQENKSCESAKSSS